MKTAFSSFIYSRRGIYGILHILILLMSLFLVISISIDTFHNIPFLNQGSYLKIQFWICMFFLFDFLLEFFALAKAKGIHTTLDTAGNPFTREEPFFGKFRKLMELTDLVMLDFKEMDGVRHKELTGVANDNILDLARYLSDTGKDMWIRHVLVPGLTDQEDDLKAMQGMLDELKTVKKVEILPYHSLGLFKWQNLGIPYTLEGVPAPTKEEVERAEKILGIRKAD